MARVALGAVGAIVGGFFGGPAGAQWGWAIGSAVGGLVDPQVIKGPSVGDVAQQTSQEGVPIPIVFGHSPPFAGNVIATSEPRIVKKKQRGKGGPSVETESVYRTYAIGICQGPIAGILRVWRNGVLVYDSSESATVDNTGFLDKARIFLGSYTQDPSPDLEAIYGAGTTPAHRGLAYLVMVDEDLTETRGAIPQFQFQVAKADFQAGDQIDLYTTHGVYTWSKRAGLISATVRVIGAGAGAASGGGGPNTARFGGSGAGGGFVEFAIDASYLGATETVTVGEGGDGGAPVIAKSIGVQGNDGTDGGDSSFGSWATARGGDKGVAFKGIGPAASEGGTAFTTADPGPTDVVTESGGRGWTEYSGSPLGTTRSGAGGGQGKGQNGAKCAFTEAGEPYYGGPGGYGGVGGTPGTGGSPGTWPGGGGGGGGASESDSPDTGPPSGAGGPGADGMVMVINKMPYTPPSSLADAVAAICEMAGLSSDMYDVSELVDDLKGFMVTNSYPASSALLALSEAFFFDASNFDGVLHFLPRGANSVATVTEDDMLDDEDDIEQQRRSDAISVPRVMNLNYYDIAGGLNTDKQASERPGDRRSLGSVSIQTAVVMDADQAAQCVHKNHKILIEDQRGELKFSLPDNWLKLTVADPIIVQWQGRSERCRITEVDVQDGYQSYTCLRDRQSAYTSEVEGIPAAPQTAPPSSQVGLSYLAVLDMPLLRDSDDASGLGYYIAVSGEKEAWRGALVELSYDGGANYVDSVPVYASSIVGYLNDDCGSHPREYPDETNIIRLSIKTPAAELEETDLAGLLNRSNLAIVGDEIVQFAEANQTSSEEWELSYLVRGRRNTEVSAHSAGERFVLLDSALVELTPANVSDVGRSLTFRATSFGATTDTGMIAIVNYAGRNQYEYPVSYLTARRNGGNVEISWQGAGRLGGAANPTNSQYFTGYRVDVIGSATVSVDTTDQEVTVSDPGGSLTVRVSALNRLTGAGPATEVAL